jgi:hypothetical protein
MTGVNPGRSAVKFLLDSNLILYHLNDRLKGTSKNKRFPVLLRT